MDLVNRLSREIEFSHIGPELELGGIVIRSVEENRVVCVMSKLFEVESQRLRLVEPLPHKICCLRCYTEVLQKLLKSFYTLPFYTSYRLECHKKMGTWICSASPALHIQSLLNQSQY